MVDKFVSRMHKHVRLITVFAVVAALFVCAVFVCVKPTTARADGGIQGSDYFTTNARYVNDSAEGVAFGSDRNETYTAKLNGIFTDNFSMGLTYLPFGEVLTTNHDGLNTWNTAQKFVVRVAAVSDPTESFDIVYMIHSNSWTTVALVYYNGAYYGQNNAWQAIKISTFDAGYGTNVYSGTQSAISVCPRFGNGNNALTDGNAGKESGLLELKWGGDDDTILRVFAQSDDSGSAANYLVCQFNGEDGKTKMTAMKDGYTVTLISDNTDAISWNGGWIAKNSHMRVTSINGRNMGTSGTGMIADFTPAPIFGNIPTLHAKVGTALTVPDATVTLLNSDQTAVTVGTQWKTTVQSSASTTYAEETEINGSFTPDARGDYTLTYYGAESLGNAAINKKTATVTAYEKGTTELVTAPNNVTVAAGKANSTVLESLGANGLGLTFNESGTVKLNAIFTGDFDLTFQIDSLAHRGVQQFETLTFRFTPIAGGKPIDAVVYTGVGSKLSWEQWYSFMYVGYGEQKFTSGKNAGTVYGTSEIENSEADKSQNSDKSDMTDNAGLCDALLKYHADTNRAMPEHLGVLKFDKTNLAVKTAAKKDSGEYGDYVLASFNDSKYAWENNTVSADFANGYTVEIIGATSQTDATVTLHSLNGLNLASVGVPTEFATESKIIKGKSSISIERENAAYADEGVYRVRQASSANTLNLLVGETDTGFSVKQGSTPVSDFRLNSAAGTYTVEYATGVTRTVVLTEDETPPAVTWKNGTPDAIAVGGVTPSIDDVAANDALDGAITLTAGNTKIFVQPSGGTETEYTSGYTFTAGEYAILYKVKDSHNNEGVFTRNVLIVEETAAVWTIGDVPTAAIVGKVVHLPTATGTVDGTPCAVTVSVTSPSHTAVLTNAPAASAQQFAADEAGEYQIIYRMSVQSVDPIIKEYTLTATKDETKPTITVSVNQTSVGTGKTVTVPIATANDPEDGSVLVTYEVKFGTTVITVTDGKFTTANEGTYTIVYTARDSSDNVRTETFTIEAVSGGADWTNQAPTTDDSNNPNTPTKPTVIGGGKKNVLSVGAIAGIVIGAVAGVLLIAAAVVFVLRIVKKKKASAGDKKDETRD